MRLLMRLSMRNGGWRGGWGGRLERPNRVAIYGWHYLNGQPIQPTYAGHVDWYIDYSHGIRPVRRRLA